MVLAAGHGSRMRPLSSVFPKPALPLPEGPVIASSIRLAVSCGARRLAVNTWHLAEIMERELAGTLPAGVEAGVSREAELMGTAGGLALARERGLLGDSGPILVLNGDSLLWLDVDRLLDHHRRSGDRVTLALLPHLDPRRWSRVLVGDRDLVTAILSPGDPEPGEAPFLYPGVMVLSREALQELPVEPGEIGELLWRPAMEENLLGGVVVSGHWREVGTPADYLSAAIFQLDGRSVVDPSATVSSLSRLVQVFAGRDTRVEQSAVVKNSVVAEGAVVGREARVISSVLLGPIELHSGEEVVDEYRTAALRET
jgi:NDP-sugar pyrophosphorylase family protein